MECVEQLNEGIIQGEASQNYYCSINFKSSTGVRNGHSIFWNVTLNESYCILRKENISFDGTRENLVSFCAAERVIEY